MRELHCSAAHPTNGGYLNCGDTVEWCTAYLRQKAMRFHNLPPESNVAIIDDWGERHWFHELRHTNEAVLRRQMLVWVRRVAEPCCCVLCMDE